MTLTNTSTCLAHGGNLLDNDEQGESPNWETIRESFVEARLACMFLHNKVISHEKDVIEVESFAKSSFDFNPITAGAQGQRQQKTSKSKLGRQIRYVTLLTTTRTTINLVIMLIMTVTMKIPCEISYYTQFT